MIEAKELRIGNLLTHDARTCRVTSLIENGESNYDIETRFVKGGEVRFNSIIYVGLEPIPLTEEWLIKFGFVSLDAEEDYYEWGLPNENGERFALEQHGYNPTKQPYVFVYDLGLGQQEIKIKHVHQLQNLYFALTGEELTIKENH
jgi:hypothetical protein